MTPGALVGLVGQSLRRGRRSFLLSAFGIAVGIAFLVFFLALSQGVRHQVLGRIFPVDQLEVIPASSSLGGALSALSLGGPRPLTDEAVAVLRARPEVRAAYRRQKIVFPARAWGGKELLGREVYAELIAEGIDPEAMAGDDLGPRPFAVEPASERACSTDAECGAGQYCPWDTHRCEHPVPVVISPFLVELYNGTLAPSHHLPKIGRFLASRFRGFTFMAELGRGFLGPGRPGVEPHQRRLMLVGVSPRAGQLALTVPLEHVRRWNAEYAGPAAARELTSVLLVLHDGADVTRLSSAVRELGFAVADSGAEKAGLAILLVTLLFAVVSVAVVSVAAINIAHGFYRMVAERRHEIGVLRALGASAADVHRLLMGEAVSIGVAGGLVGILLGRAGALAVDAAARRWVPDFPFKPESFFSFDAAILGGALACAILACLVGAAAPARAASRVDPSEALSST